MSLLLSILLITNMLGAIFLIPALMTYFKPKFASTVGGPTGATAEEAPAAQAAS